MAWTPSVRIVASEYAGENLFHRVATAQDAVSGGETLDRCSTAARSHQWVEQRRSSRQHPTADGGLPLPSLRPAARLREPIGQLFADVCACEAIHRKFAAADCLDLMGGEGREDESVGDVDAELVTASERCRATSSLVRLRPAIPTYRSASPRQIVYTPAATWGTASLGQSAKRCNDP